MNAATINLSTGPVQISPKVLTALASAPISHRSREFRELYKSTIESLCKQFNMDRCYLFTGSGTAANEAMLWQIKALGTKGAILSNGEFGERLMKQAARMSLPFLELRSGRGRKFDMSEMEKLLKQHHIKWVLMCHCETSTGVMNDLKALVDVCARNNWLCFADCMSTVGASGTDISKVAMATASSGKGLASVPGLAIVFSNIKPSSSIAIPFYLDLNNYDENDGVPFTISSNLVRALQVAITCKFQPEQLALIDHFTKKCFSLLNEMDVLPFDNSGSNVFTLFFPGDARNRFIKKVESHQIILSYESEYLKKMKLCQIAIMGCYEQNELSEFMKVLEQSFASCAK